MGKSIKTTNEFAMSDHLLHCDFFITSDDFDILSSDSSKFKSLINESLLIKRDKSALNRTRKSFALNLFDVFR